MKAHLHILAALAAATLSSQVLADCVAVETGHPSAQAAAVAAPVSSDKVIAVPSDTSSAKNTAVILRPVALRDRPVADGTGDVVAVADTRVRLERGVKNGDGNWWYVTASGLGGGWVMTDDLANLPQQ